MTDEKKPGLTADEAWTQLLRCHHPAEVHVKLPETLTFPLRVEGELGGLRVTDAEGRTVFRFRATDFGHDEDRAHAEFLVRVVNESRCPHCAAGEPLKPQHGLERYRMVTKPDKTSTGFAHVWVRCGASE